MFEQNDDGSNVAGQQMQQYPNCSPADSWKMVQLEANVFHPLIVWTNNNPILLLLHKMNERHEERLATQLPCACNL